MDQPVDQLNERIHAYIRENGRYASGLFWVKCIFLLASWVTLYALIISQTINSGAWNFIFALLWGMVSLLIIFNIGHDAVHGVVSSNSKINQILGYTFNLVGANAYSWRLKHNVAHHVHTNKEGLDFDTDLDPLLRVSNRAKHRRYYKYQIWWVIPVYSLLSLLILFVADFKIFFQTKNAGLVKSHASKEWGILLLTKLYYVILVFIIPLSVGYSFASILLAFICYHLLNGIIIACVFMPSHYFTRSKFYQRKDKTEDWLEHQMSTTMDLSGRSKFVFHLLGGLNLNVAHHLYPQFCHTHYFKVSKIINDYCKERGLQQNEMSFGSAIVDHLKHVKSIGYA